MKDVDRKVMRKRNDERNAALGYDISTQHCNWPRLLDKLIDSNPGLFLAPFKDKSQYRSVLECLCHQTT